MCGILGKISGELDKKFEDALHLLNHRGPDFSATQKFNLSSLKVQLGHARLAIIDLDNSACQPMDSECERYSIVFNGEIYNFLELKKKLQDIGVNFKTTSDTEVLLYYWIHFGKKGLRDLLGMFSFAVLDKKEQKLSLIRDAFGIKPLYYIHENEKFLFCSEIGPLLKISGEDIIINKQSAYNYLVHGSYENTEETFIDGINQVKPAEVIDVFINDNLEISHKIWWVPKIKKSNATSLREAADEFRYLFLSTLKKHLRSDVKVGATLSGGLDSSAIVCGMRHLEPDLEINTFSFVEKKSSKSEKKWIDLVNQKVNAVFHHTSLGDGKIDDDLLNLIKIQGEPFGSTSIYAQYKVMEMVHSKGIKVILDGQGADELFAGYHGYPGYRIRSLLELRNYRALVQFVSNWYKWPGRYLGGDILDYLRITLPDNFYSLLRKVKGRDFEPPWLKLDLFRDCGVTFEEQRDEFSKNFLGQRINEKMINVVNQRGLRSLLKVADRNSMAFSVEARVPFLTIDMFNFALSLPEEYKISNAGQTKSVIREGLRDILPKEILDRKDKIGFETDQQRLLGRNKAIVEQSILNWAQSDHTIHEQTLEHYLNKFQSKNSETDQVWRLLNYGIWHSSINQNI